MDEARREPGIAQTGRGGAQALDLARGLGRRRIVGAGKIREGPGQPQARSVPEESDHEVQLLSAEARAAHAGVELEMNRQRNGEAPRGGRDRLGLGRVVERRRQTVGGEPGHVLGVHARKNEDLSGNPAAAERRPLLRIRDRETVGARAGEARRHRNRAVAVGIRLDHRVDAAGRNPTREKPVVGRDRVEIDDRPNGKLSVES